MASRKEITPEEREVITWAKVWRAEFWTPINSRTLKFDYRIAERLAEAVDKLSMMEPFGVDVLNANDPAGREAKT